MLKLRSIHQLHLNNRIVLQLSEAHKNEFATHAVDFEGNLYWGHYFDNWDNALQDFKSRIESAFNGSLVEFTNTTHKEESAA